MANELNIVALCEGLQHLRGQVAITIIDLMEILNYMCLTGAPPLLFEFFAFAKQRSGLGYTRHNA
jgi:hypothetical protein